MCGIVGFWDANQRVVEHESTLRRMVRSLAHRGPDDAGHFFDANAGVALGHRRLSILDLSPQGHQPMTSASGRYVVVFNGEVYNHQELRKDLQREHCKFRGHSDTEVMLASIERWGLAAAIARFNGMFAFALWDRKDTSLSLVRDRLGVKPLYFGWVGSCFVFSSELKGMRALPGFENGINQGALTLLLRHNYIPAPYSIYDHIFKLIPGTILRMDRRRAAQKHTLDELKCCTATYWSAKAVAEAGSTNRFSGTEDEATAELESVLISAVGLRMEADVPVGAFLSGGVDSSAVVALMQAQSSRPIRTFSIGFHESKYDEAAHAKLVAQHLRTDHSELYVSPQDALDVIPSLPQMYDEPFADSSQIPTFLVSQFARQQVKVSLSGDGGDELFAGYDRYLFARVLWSQLKRIPGPLRRAVAKCIRLNPNLWAAVLAHSMPLLPKRLQVTNPRSKIHLLAELFIHDSIDALYGELTSHWKSPTSVVLGGHEPETALTDPGKYAQLEDNVERMMYADLISYFPDDILTKVDRASMAVGLEARVPLSDYRVVEFAWRLPMEMKLSRARSKCLLREVLYRYVPRKLIERPKQGFGVPISEWLRGPLRDWAESLLDERRLRDEGHFNPGMIRAAWESHLHVRPDHYRLWDVLMFQAWLENVTNESSTPLLDSAPHSSTLSSHDSSLSWTRSCQPT